MANYILQLNVDKTEALIIASDNFQSAIRQNLCDLSSSSSRLIFNAHIKRLTQSCFSPMKHSKLWSVVNEMEMLIHAFISSCLDLTCVLCLFPLYTLSGVLSVLSFQFYLILFSFIYLIVEHFVTDICERCYINKLSLLACSPACCTQREAPICIHGTAQQHSNSTINFISTTTITKNSGGSNTIIENNFKSSQEKDHIIYLHSFGAQRSIKTSPLSYQ